MTHYSADSSAAAVIIFDNGSSHIASIGARALTYRRHVKIKIFRREAFDEWANVVVFVERGAFSKLKGVTYNLVNDSIVKSEIDDNAIFKTRFNKYLDEIKFTLPNVREGSVIEYSYVIKGDGVPGWKFQYAIPVVQSEYTVEVPAVYKVRHTVTGLFSPTYETSNGKEKWMLNNIPAFRSEPFMPSETDFVSGLAFSYSSNSWNAINENLWFDVNFGGTIKGFPFLKKDAEQITASLTDPKLKIIAIQQYIKNHLTWDGTKDIYAADDLKDNFRRKAGTAADINLAMASMLQKVGIPVDMVLLSTRGNGFVRMDYPTLRQFDYAVCLAYADTVPYLLDATEKYLLWNVLPERCLNGVGLVISGKGYTWARLSSTTKRRTVASADLALNDHGQLQGMLTYTRDGYAANEMRSRYNKYGQDAYLADFVKNPVWNVLKSEFRNLDDIEKSAIEAHEILIPEPQTTTGNLIYINPFIAFKEEKNPFQADKRQFPVDFVVQHENIYLTNITIPEGYIVDEIPQPKVLALPKNKGKFTYTTNQIGNRLTILSNIQINESMFTPEEYPALKEFYNRIIAKLAEQIVLKKK